MHARLAPVVQAACITAHTQKTGCITTSDTGTAASFTVALHLRRMIDAFGELPLQLRAEVVTKYSELANVTPLTQDYDERVGDVLSSSC